MLAAKFKNAAQPFIVTCEPLHFSNDPDSPANAKEAQYTAVDSARALSLHRAFTALCTQKGAVISQMPPTLGTPGQVYTADPAWTIYNPKTNELTLIRSRFTNQRRQSEVDAFTDHFKSLTAPGGALAGVKLTIHDIPFAFEGTGDAYYDSFRDRIFAGYVQNPDPANPGAGRSAIEAHAELERITGIPVTSIEMLPPCFHIDIALCPLPTGHMLIYKGGMTEDSYNDLVQNEFIAKGLDPAEYLIEVSESDALQNFVTNLICFDDNILLPYFGEDADRPDPALIARLQAIGYNVELVEYGELIKGSGALHCTAHLLQTRVQGGHIAQNNAAPVTEPA